MALDQIFWIGGLLAEVALLSILIRNRVFRLLPAFTVYIAWSLLVDAGFFVLRNWISGLGALASYRLYSAQMAIDSALIFAVLVELAGSVLRPVRGVLPGRAWIWIAVLIAVACLALWPVAGLTVPARLTTEGDVFFRLQQTFAILRVVVFLAMAGFSQLLSIGWRNRELQVATGLGFYSIVSLAVSVAHTHQPVGPAYHVLDQLLAFGYVSTLSYWVLSFTTKEAERKKFTPQMERILLLVGGTARSGRAQVTDFVVTGGREKDER